MRSRLDAFREYATYTLLLWVVINFVVFRFVAGTDLFLESVLSLALAGPLGYLVFGYSTSRLPGTEPVERR
ncbi:hypothetical protein GCM10028857_11770 [Salinarchaeum chitinilyticum]